MDVDRLGVVIRPEGRNSHINFDGTPDNGESSSRDVKRIDSAGIDWRRNGFFNWKWERLKPDIFLLDCDDAELWA